MRPDEFLWTLRRLNVTKAEFSREIGVHRVTLQRYGNGSLPVPTLLRRYLELRLTHDAAVAEMRTQADKLEAMSR